MTPPGKPLGMSDFFALEAGEYLERLDSLLQQSETPRADEFVRLARALRGSALMANQQATAKAAAGVESLARALREGRRPWDAHTQQLAVRAIDDLKIFVRRAANWSEADSAKAEALAAQLDQLAGRPSAQVRAAEALGLDAGARAFVAREGPEFRSFAALLVQFLESEPDVVPVTSLYYEDAGPHVVKQGVPAARPATLGRLELVSHGEHLRQAADSLERAPSPTQRELRAHTLAGTFRALAQAGGGALPERVAQFAAAAREAVPETPDLVGSWAVYQRLTRAGVGPASLEEIVARTAPRAPSLDTGRPVDSSIVDIRTLLYRGERALQRAQELRAQEGAL